LTRILRTAASLAILSLLAVLAAACGGSSKSSSTSTPTSQTSSQTSSAPSTNTVSDLTSAMLLTNTQLSDGNAGKELHGITTDFNIAEKNCSSTPDTRNKPGFQQGAYHIFFTADQKTFVSIVCIYRYTDVAAAQKIYALPAKPSKSKVTYTPFSGLGDEAKQATATSSTGVKGYGYLWRHANVVAAVQVAGPKANASIALVLARQVQAELSGTASSQTSSSSSSG